MSATAFLYHPVFLKHETGPGHPESPQRLKAILARLDESGVLSQCLRTDFTGAPFEAIARVHDPAHIAHVAAHSSLGRHFAESADTAGSSGTYQAAVMAAGAVIKACDMVMDGVATNAFCAVRPPGHHAERGEAMGFCFFNNVAIAARHLQAEHGIKRVAIVDWDVHHGNGTQHSFYDDPTVFYFSTHQWPHYPGTGRRDDTGIADGKGFTLNAPLAAASTDTDYIQVFQERLRPALRSFNPEFILISAGFDAHSDDPLSRTMVSTGGFGQLTREVVLMAREHCRGRLVSVLEGGYDLRSLADSVEAHMRVLMEDADVAVSG